MIIRTNPAAMDLVRESDMLVRLAGTSRAADEELAKRAPELLAELSSELEDALKANEELQKRNDELENVEEERGWFEEENKRLEDRLAKLDERCADLQAEKREIAGTCDELRARAEKAEYEVQRLRFALQGQKDKTPTAKQLEALKALERAPASAWDFGSTTVHRLRLNGWAEDDTNRETHIRITDKGRAVLERARVAEAHLLERKDDKP